MAHHEGAGPLTAHARARVAILHLRVAVGAYGRRLVAFPDGVTHSHGAHPLAVDANARVAVLVLDRFVLTNASKPDFTSFGQGVKI